MIDVRQRLPLPSGAPGHYTSLPHIKPWNTIRNETLGSGVGLRRHDRAQ